MKKYIIALLLVPILTMAQTESENYIVTTRYLEASSGQFFSHYQDLTPSQLIFNNVSGSIFGSLRVEDDLVEFEFSGQLSSYEKVNIDTEIPLNADPAIPDTDLGSIIDENGLATGYYAKISNNALILHSPYYLTGVNTQLEASLDFESNYTYDFKDLHEGISEARGTSAAHVIIDGNTLMLNIDGEWDADCNLKTGYIGKLIGLEKEISNMELGNIISNKGEETIYRARIINNELFFYSSEVHIAQFPVKFLTYRSLYLANKQQSIIYVDGLGRPKQNIALKQGGQKQDVVTPITYDEFGRRAKKYLPFADSSQTTSSANYRDPSQLITSVNNSYLFKFPENINYSLPNPYSETIFEASPLNRIKESAAPGYSWINSSGNDHTIKTEYDVNSLADQVKRYKVISTGVNNPIEQTEYYGQGALYKNITKDENWISGRDHTIEEYKDNSGNIVLKRQFNDSEILDTYYVYNQYNQLVYVLPPLIQTQDLFINSNIGPMDDLAPFYINQSVFTGTGNGGGNAAISISTLTSGEKELKIDFNGSFISSYLSEIPYNLPTSPCKLPDSFLGYLYSDNSYSVSIIDGKLKITKHQDILKTGFSKIFTLILPNCTQRIVSQPVLDAYCYQYQYDAKQRLVEKQIPGKGREYIVYDKLDRPVLTQDANLRSQNRWLFSKYDQFGRIVYNGDYTSLPTDTRSSIQSQMDNLTNQNLFEQQTSQGFINGNANILYTNSSFPTASINVFQANYYDNYNFLQGINPVPAYVFGKQVTSRIKSLPTGSIVRVLDYDRWITNIQAYDNKGRSIFNYVKDDFLSFNTTVFTQLSFVGKPILTKTLHKKKNIGISLNSWDTTTFYDYYSYDHAGRPLTIVNNHQTNDHMEMIAYNSYDELGQLTQKKIGGSFNKLAKYEDISGLQTVDYKYNIRGWLTDINDVNNLGNDLFTFNIKYDNPGLSSFALYNGNISQTSWSTINDSGTNIIRKYDYIYDSLNRLTDAQFTKLGNVTLQGLYDENLTYDLNGNILSLKRKGTNDESMQIIDNLSYNYNGNRLESVTDLSFSNLGFVDNHDGIDYIYDANGNMTKDYNKGIGVSSEGISYNHLNLPTSINFSPSGIISYTYNSNGVKLLKHVLSGPQPIKTEYCGKFIYDGTVLGTSPQFFYGHSEGYISKNVNGSFDYIYQYKDHLGNVRISYNDSNTDGTISATEVINEDNYYPFGLKHTGYNYTEMSLGNSTAQKIKYNGKELQDELGLGWYDYQARNYDPALGRWMNIDPLAETSRRWSAYTYAYNNPIRFVDPDGMQGQDIIDINKRNGFTKVTKASGNDVVRIIDSKNNNKVVSSYTYGKNGSFSKDTSIKNIVTKKADGIYDKITSQEIHFSNASKADKFFKFAAQSNVEFGLIGVSDKKLGSSETVVKTDFKITSVGATSYAESVLNSNPNAIITRLSHSHPYIGSAYPSGFNPDLTPDPTTDGDRNRYIELHSPKNNSRLPTYSEMYFGGPDPVEIKYNGTKAFKTNE